MFSYILISCLLISWSGGIESQSIIEESHNVTKTVIGLSCGLVKKSAQNTVDWAYAGCNNGIKTCYGDREECVETKSCSRMSSLTMNSTAFKVEFYSKCALDLRPGKWGDYFLAAAVNETVEVQEVDGKQRVTCKDPKREDFRLFHFWPRSQEKCDPWSKNFALEVIGSQIVTLDSVREKCQQKYPEDFSGVVDIPNNFNLTHWIDNNILLQHATGWFANKKGPQIAKRVDYEIVGGISMISSPYEKAPWKIETTTRRQTSAAGSLYHSTFFNVSILLSLVYFLRIMNS